MECVDLRAELEEAVANGRPLPDFARDARAYVREALDAELRSLRKSSGPPSPPVRLLIALCGTSPQPVLLSTHHLAPEVLLLVGTKTEHGRATVRDVRAYSPPRATVREPIEVDGSDPMKSFGQLREKLRPHLEGHPPGTVAVDITGGKKTMVAAGFMLATELGLRMFYVDGEYVPEARIPLPCTAVLRELRDPVVGFRLQEIRRAEERYWRGRFDGASELFAEAAEALSETVTPPLRRADELRRWATVARTADAWERARYDEAEESVLPDSLRPLCDAWRRLPCGRIRLARLVESERDVVLRFAADRLGWALFRRTQRDLRSSIVDAYSACEVAVDALVLALLRDGRWTVEGWTRPPDDALRKIKRQMVQDAEDALRKGGPGCFGKITVRPGVPGLGDEYPAVFGSEIGEHRNALVHAIEGVDERIAERLLDGSPCLAVRLLRRLAKAMAHRDQDIVLVDEVLSAQRPPAFAL